MATNSQINSTATTATTGKSATDLALQKIASVEVPQGKHIALEIHGQHQKSVDFAGQDHAAPLREIADADGHGRFRGGIHHADDGARQIRTIEVEDSDRQSRRQSGAEDGGEERHLGKRDDRRQAEQKRPPP